MTMTRGRLSWRPLDARGRSLARQYTDEVSAVNMRRATDRLEQQIRDLENCGERGVQNIRYASEGLLLPYLRRKLNS